MPARGSDKCRQCSKLSLEQALEKHGPDGTGCWNGEPCHKRRTYYKNRDRYNRDRRLKYMGDKHSSALLDGIDIPTIPAVVIHFYRQRKDEPLHALGIELWIGQQRKASLQPVHTMGWTEGQVKGYIKDAITQFSHKYEVQITGVAASIELSPNLCPLLPCPLKIDRAGIGEQS
jgi:hypothetical protein